jgi:hypothetical protein
VRFPPEHHEFTPCPSSLNKSLIYSMSHNLIKKRQAQLYRTNGAFIISRHKPSVAMMANYYLSVCACCISQKTAHPDCCVLFSILIILWRSAGVGRVPYFQITVMVS